MRVLILGFGNVARRLAEILADRASYPGLDGLDVSVVGITTGSRGAAVDPVGLRLGRALAEISARGRFGEGYPEAATLTSEEALRSLDYDVAVELTPLDIRGRGAAAISHVRTALERGGHVITCNKGPIAWAW